MRRTDAARAARTWWSSDQGSATVELTLIAPVLVVVLVLVAVVAHRSVDARLRVDAAAHQAARAASLERTAADASRAATATAAAALGPADTSCSSVDVVADTSAFRAGGSVTVSVSCSVDLTAALPLAVPGRVEVSARASEPVDVYRSTTDTP